MKKRIIELLNQNFRVTLFFIDGQKLTFSNVANELDDDDSVIELNDGENSINFVVNIKHIHYLKYFEVEKVQSVNF